MPSTRPVRILAVIGAGNMGSGIAQKAATEGFPVILVDLDDAKVARGLAIISCTVQAAATTSGEVASPGMTSTRRFLAGW